MGVSVRETVFAPVQGERRQRKELPVHHKLEEILDRYLKATGLEKEQVSVLLTAPTVSGRILLK
jgi:hypothetical protein